jgi:hypothetical protein
MTELARSRTVNHQESAGAITVDPEEICDGPRQIIGIGKRFPEAIHIGVRETLRGRVVRL